MDRTDRNETTFRLRPATGYENPDSDPAATPVSHPSPLGPAPEDLFWLGRILERLRERWGVDFQQYRPATILRRIRNRMLTAGVPTLPEYLERLNEPGEDARLLERLTIKVSRFFRNAAAFDALKAELERRRAAAPRWAPAIWSAGCGQGEEPYSVAILLAELRPDGDADRPVLATDVDPAALATATRGRYPAAALEELPPELRLRYFDRDPASAQPAWSVAPGVRRRVTFTLHDLSACRAPVDRQFDLICCRNVLIYFQPPLQDRVQRLLRDSLVPGGLLWLGEAEWLLPAIGPDFDILDRNGRLFAKRRSYGGRS